MDPETKGVAYKKVPVFTLVSEGQQFDALAIEDEDPDGESGRSRAPRSSPRRKRTLRQAKAEGFMSHVFSSGLRERASILPRSKPIRKSLTLDGRGRRAEIGIGKTLIRYTRGLYRARGIICKRKLSTECRIGDDGLDVGWDDNWNWIRCFMKTIAEVPKVLVRAVFRLAVIN